MGLDIKKKGKGAQGTTWVEKEGAKEEKSETVGVFPVPTGDSPYANVNVSLGARIGLPNYSDFRCGASLTIPCAAAPDDIEMAYEYAKEWCKGKIEELTGLIEDE